MTELLRWFLVLPSAPLGFYLAFRLTLLTGSFIDNSCYSEGVTAEVCTSGLYTASQKAVIICGSALAAIFVVVFPTLVAPTGKLEVALTFYVAGAFTAFLMIGWLIRGGGVFILLAALTTALAAGAFLVVFIKRFLAEKTLQVH